MSTVDNKPRLKTSAMIASIAADGQATRAAPFGHALAKLARTNDNVIGMTADLGKYTDLHIFAKEFPERYYQMGMAEQLLMGAAAGFAHEGAQPFVTTYAVFATRRAYDFIHQAIAEDNLDVKLVCALPGLTTGYGPSHQAAEDLALMRAMPNMTVIDPCDALDIEQMVPAIAAHKGPVYARLLRGNVPAVLHEYDYRFELGKAKLLRDGNDVLLISSGIVTMRSLEVAKALEADRIDAAVLHVPTIKPLDVATIVREAERNGRMVIVAENHTVIGGLGEAVATVLLAAGVAVPFRQIGLPDAYLAAGALPTLHDRYGISAGAMRAKIRSWLG
ncbi:transketolase [Burkholderia ubonensis]|uniref:transketolase family protein n=1 Tax=Burkholderia ubonensis TaxID=101571 RepID=UPI000754B722|nr:transketolase family protein [Burkholderia ubonensis]KVA73743.1 transketolase [Burkholderia ubonensis]KVD36039.1 transketolase [Burkholderia ubonensis]KVN88446.1 transketolase [Burkholderia ubonensis]KVO12216.1 transketolase [Burkholderia ubonensis]KVO25569.1 transketolase [Burkholderia ubonensis]